MSEVRLPAPVKATVVEDIDDAPGVAGAIELRADIVGCEGVAMRCPCGCGRESWLALGREDHPSWEWDGNRDAPTLWPSVAFKDGHWHGFLRAGMWVQA